MTRDDQSFVMHCNALVTNSTSRDARATRGRRRRWTTTRIDARRSMDFVARARARETPRGGGQEATTSATSGREILLREARDARDARRWARERASAAVRCQRARRRHVARREATRREIEALDAVIERMAREANANANANAKATVAFFDVAIAILRRRGSFKEMGLERAFRAYALALKWVEGLRMGYDAGTLEALATNALATASDEDARARLPALVACAVKFACGLCDADENLAARVHGAVCEALTVVLEADGFEHRAVVARALAPSAFAPLTSGGDDASFSALAVRLLGIPQLRTNLPADAVRILEEPKTLTRVLRACSARRNRGAECAIENVLALMCKGSKGGENVRAFVEADDDNSVTALRALAELSASARAQSANWHSRLSSESRFRASATNAMSETWFLASLVGGNDGCIASPDKAAEVASLYAELSRANKDGVYSACAFSPGYLHSLWNHLARALSLPSKVSDSDRASWVASTFAHRGILDLSHSELERFGYFCSAYTYLLVVLRDKQFFEEQKPFSLDEQRAIAVAVNTLIVRSHASNQVHLITEDMKRSINAASELLHALTTRDARRAFAPKELWLAPNSMELEPAVAASALQSQIDGGAPTQITGLLNDCPHALSFDERVKIFRELIKADRLKAGYRPQAGGADAAHGDTFARPVAQVTLRRESVLEDTLTSVLPLGTKARGRILVKFVNAAGQEEAGIDAGGLFKELLSQVTEQGLDPNRGLFQSNATGLIYPSPRAGDTHEGILLLEMIGMMIGKGMYEGILQDINMAPFFAAHVLGTARTIDDIPSLDEDLARSIVQILEYEGDVADLCLDFTCSEEIYGELVTRELVAGGRDVEVTAANKLFYVFSLADYHLNRRIATPMLAFMRGLTKIINQRWLRLFNVTELSLLLSGGESAIDVDDWELHTRYSGGYSSSSATVRNFWRVMRKFTPKQRQDVLKFVTSSPRPPLQGFKHLNPPFVIHKVRCEASMFAYFGATDVRRLPSASTCFNMLKLPNYRRASTLEKSVSYASQSRAGFELS